MLMSSQRRNFNDRRNFNAFSMTVEIFLRFSTLFRPSKFRRQFNIESTSKMPTGFQDATSKKSMVWSQLTISLSKQICKKYFSQKCYEAVRFYWYKKELWANWGVGVELQYRSRITATSMAQICNCLDYFLWLFLVVSSKLYL